MKKAPGHRSLVFSSPWSGIYCTHTQSGRHFGRHSHATYGFGLLEHGAHRSLSGRGPVEAYAGDVITTNPGEVHDGRPLGGPSRRWRIVYVEPGALASMTADPVFSAQRGIRAWTITRAVGDRCGRRRAAAVAVWPAETSPAMTTLGKSRLGWNGLALPPRVERPRASLLEEPRLRDRLERRAAPAGDDDARPKSWPCDRRTYGETELVLYQFNTTTASTTLQALWRPSILRPRLDPTRWALTFVALTV